MSAIDRAFVKAFAKQPMRPAPAALRQGQAELPNDARRRRVSVDAPHAAVPPPHAPFTARGSDHENANNSRAIQSTQEAHVAVGREDNPLEEHPLEPAFEVDRFAWPDVCRRLIEQSGNQLNRLVDALQAGEQAEQASTVLVTACQAGEGRSTVLLSLALALAQNHLRVALVDADFESGGLAERLGIAPQIGMDDVVGKSISAAEAMIESIADAVTLVPLRSAGKQSSDLVKHPRWHATLTALGRQYDVVLIAGSPLVGSLDTNPSQGWIRSLGIDMAVIVHDARLNSSESLERAVRTLEEDEIKNLVIVENFVHSPATHAA